MVVRSSLNHRCCKCQHYIFCIFSIRQLNFVSFVKESRHFLMNFCDSCKCYVQLIFQISYFSCTAARPDIDSPISSIFRVTSAFLLALFVFSAVNSSESSYMLLILHHLAYCYLLSL